MKNANHAQIIDAKKQNSIFGDEGRLGNNVYLPIKSSSEDCSSDLLRAGWITANVIVGEHSGS